MLRQSFHPLLLVMFGLALLGIGSNLVTDPRGFFVSMLVMVGVATLLYLLFKNIVMPRLSQANYGRQMSANAYKTQARSGNRTPSFKAAKQKKAKQEKKRSQRPLIKRQSDVQLRVIEGKKNKSKKKNRALF
ncbi:hypothetical protein [Alteribacter aurantiacus]|uniref:hypothetical protein n=1 Tax=Alteribacter aurantiacus TaxID=254410 RepID=UPI0003F9A00B|nr:hypothetical protein [Alteribacter aurantiacus]